MPPPRADTPLNTIQVQQATEDLITERNHLNGETQSSGTGSGISPAAKSQPAKLQPAIVTTGSAGSQNATTAGSQAAGTETK